LPYDIAGDIMTQDQIDRWRQRLAEMYEQRDLMAKDLIPCALAVGRKQRAGSSPPVYILKGRPPLPVHAHPVPLKKIVRQKSVEILEGDLDMWEMHLSEGKVNPNGNA